MNILVCVKQVPKDEDLRLDPETKTLIRTQSEGRISEYDKYALEMALRLRETCGGRVTAISMGPPQSANVLRYCLSLGADEVYLLSDRKMGGADAYATVNAISAAKKHLELSGERYDLILCGKQASDSDTSLVMPELAETLGWPQVTFVKDFSYAGDGCLRVIRETDDGSETILVGLPAVMSIGKAEFEVRYPTIRMKLATNKRDIPVLDAAALNADENMLGVLGSKTTVGDSYFPKRSKTGTVISEKAEAEAASELLGMLRASKLI